MSPLFSISSYNYQAQSPAESSSQQTPPQDYKMTVTVAEAMKTMVTSVMDLVMESNAMRLAMIISGIVFTQTSVLNFVYFLGSVQGLLG